VASFAGKYYDHGMHFLVSFTTADGKLVLQGSSLDRLEPDRFEDPVIGGVVNFSNIGGRKKATVVYNGTTTFEGTVIDDDLRLDEPVLSAYAGVFKNAELGATHTLSVEDGNLMLRINWNPAIRLQLTVQDEFTAGETTVVFGRDSGKRISRVSVFAGWNGVIRNFPLEKIN
jgi:hypothetical protein